MIIQKSIITRPSLGSSHTDDILKSAGIDLSLLGIRDSFTTFVRNLVTMPAILMGKNIAPQSYFIYKNKSMFSRLHWQNLNG